MSLRYQVTDDVSPTVPLVTVTSSTNDCLVTMSSDVDADVIKVNIEDNGEGEDKHAVAMTAQGCAQRPKKRLVHKTGECNVSNINVQQRKRRFIVDIFTTMLELKWRYNMLVFMLAFFSTWSFFGILWFVFCKQTFFLEPRLNRCKVGTDRVVVVPRDVA